MNSPAIPLDDLHTVEDFAAQHARIFTESTLRWQLRSRASNGLDELGAVVKIGKRLLISKTRFEQWLATQAEGCAR